MNSKLMQILKLKLLLRLQIIMRNSKWKDKYCRAEISQKYIPTTRYSVLGIGHIIGKDIQPFTEV